MRRFRGGVSLLALGLVLVPAANAAAPPPGAAMSDNLEYITRVPDTGQVVEGKFDRVRGKDILILTGRFGFKTLDVSNPENPKPLGSFLPKEIAAGGYWQDEDMDIDTRRKLIIGALDPRHVDSNPLSPCQGTNNEKRRNPGCKSGFYVISYADPAHLEQVGSFVELPSGHTSTCIDDCRWIWTGGPFRRSDQGFLGPWSENGRGDGRPIWVTDLRNPRKPKVFDKPIDLFRNDGWTDYTHDVDVDRLGFAWAAGRGGIRGYATRGFWRDPFTNRWRFAKPYDPVLVAGGGLAGTNQPAMFMHNSWHPLEGKVRASGVASWNILAGTEEDFADGVTGPTKCKSSGRIVLSDLSDSWGGEGAASSTPERPYRMTPLDTFHPAQDTSEDVPDDMPCSAHYFEIEGSTLAAAWYSLGLRLVDISNARDIRQVGFYRVTGTDQATNPSSNSWDMAWHGDLVYLFDMARGVEVLRLKRGGPRSSAEMESVTAPSVESNPLAQVPAGSLDQNALICPLFVDA